MTEEIKELIEEKRDSHREARDNATSEYDEAYHTGAAAALHIVWMEVSDMGEVV